MSSVLEQTYNYKEKVLEKLFSSVEYIKTSLAILLDKKVVQKNQPIENEDTFWVDLYLINNSSPIVREIAKDEIARRKKNREILDAFFNT